MVDSFNISMSELVPGDIVELRMKGGSRMVTIHVGAKSWASCIVTPKGRSYPDTLWGVVSIMEKQVGTGKAFKELDEFQKSPADVHGELFTGDFVNDSSKSLEDVMPGTGETEETFHEPAESEVAGNYAMDTLKTEDGYEVDVSTDAALLDILDNSVATIAAHLADLSYGDLITIKEAEEAGKTRKSLMKVIQAEEDRRTEGGAA